MPRTKPHTQETKDKISKALSKKISFRCIFCRKVGFTSPSTYLKKKNHFCSIICYKKFVRTLPFYEQNAYKGVRKIGQSKQIYHKNYCYRHPKRISHLKARRYAREQGAIGSHTLEQWNDLKIEFNECCAFCRKEKPLTKDHIIPLSEGGTDYIDNIQPLCKNCNSKKWKHIYENKELLAENKCPNP